MTPSPTPASTPPRNSRLENQTEPSQSRATTAPIASAASSVARTVLQNQATRPPVAPPSDSSVDSEIPPPPPGLFRQTAGLILPPGAHRIPAAAYNRNPGVRNLPATDLVGPNSTDMGHSDHSHSSHVVSEVVAVAVDVLPAGEGEDLPTLQAVPSSELTSTGLPISYPVDESVDSSQPPHSPTNPL